MFQIIRDGHIVAITDSLYFVRKHDNGCFIHTDEENAQGISLGGKVYHLLGREEIEGVENTVGYSAIDGGEYIAHQQNTIDELISQMLEG